MSRLDVVCLGWVTQGEKKQINFPVTTESRQTIKSSMEKKGSLWKKLHVFVWFIWVVVARVDQVSQLAVVF